jgi:hypothetical protein
MSKAVKKSQLTGTDRARRRPAGNRTGSIMSLGSYRALAVVLIMLGVLVGTAVGSFHQNIRFAERDPLAAKRIGDWPPHGG